MSSHSRLETNEKLQNYHKDKVEKLRKIEQDMLNENGFTFKPKLNENSLNSVNDTLLKRNEDFIRNRDIKIKSYVRNEELECTFSPKIKDIVSNDENIPVENRLYNYDQIYKQKKENFKENFNETYAFKPEINKNTDEILRKKKVLLEEIKNKYENKNEIVENNSNEDYFNNQKKRIKWKNEKNYLDSNDIVEEEIRETEGLNDNSNENITNSNLNVSSQKDLNSPKLITINSQKELQKYENNKNNDIKYISYNLEDQISNLKKSILML